MSETEAGSRVDQAACSAMARLTMSVLGQPASGETSWPVFVAATRSYNAGSTTATVEVRQVVIAAAVAASGDGVDAACADKGPNTAASAAAAIIARNRRV